MRFVLLGNSLGLRILEVVLSPKSQSSIVPTVEVLVNVTVSGEQPAVSDLVKMATGFGSTTTLNESTPVQKAVDAVNVI